MQKMLCMLWCAVGQSMGGGIAEGKYEGGLAAGIYGSSSADPEPTAKEIHYVFSNSELERILF